MEELNIGRSDVRDPTAGLNEEDKTVLMHATEAEWVLYLRSALQALCLMEDLDDVAPLSRDPPCTTAEICVDLYIKFTELASEQSGRPVGAPMLREWVLALGDQ